MTATEAGAHAPTGKIRLGEVVREARAPGSRVGRSSATPRAASRSWERRWCRRSEVCPGSTMTGRQHCTGRLCREWTSRRKIYQRRIWRDDTACHRPSWPSTSLAPRAPCPSWPRHRAETRPSRRSKRPRAVASGELACSRRNTLILEPVRKAFCRRHGSRFRQTVRLPKSPVGEIACRKGRGPSLSEGRKPQVSGENGCPLTSFAANGDYPA